jgi:glycine C-acetyltransferase
MLGDARVAVDMADRLLVEGVFVIAFSFPVVPQDRARIRTQMSAAHSDDDITMAIEAFTRVGRDMGVVS